MKCVCYAYRFFLAAVLCERFSWMIMIVIGDCDCFLCEIKQNRLERRVLFVVCRRLLKAPLTSTSADSGFSDPLRLIIDDCVTAMYCRVDGDVGKFGVPSIVMPLLVFASFVLMLLFSLSPLAFSVLPLPVLLLLSNPLVLAELPPMPPIVEPLLLLLLLLVCPIMLNSVTNISSSCARTNKFDVIYTHTKPHHERKISNNVAHKLIQKKKSLAVLA